MPHASSRPLGEQYPEGPQSESTAQLPCAHVFAVESEPDVRQRHAVPPQFWSLWQVSYEHSGAHATPGVGRHRPFCPAVQSESWTHAKEMPPS
jgi:hypothetical protein